MKYIPAYLRPPQYKFTWLQCIEHDKGSAAIEAHEHTMVDRPAKKRKVGDGEVGAEKESPSTYKLDGENETFAEDQMTVVQYISVCY